VMAGQGNDRAGAAGAGAGAGCLDHAGWRRRAGRWRGDRCLCAASWPAPVRRRAGRCRRCRALACRGSPGREYGRHSLRRAARTGWRVESARVARARRRSDHRLRRRDDRGDAADLARTGRWWSRCPLRPCWQRC
jgi:hypothetical protein